MQDRIEAGTRVIDTFDDLRPQGLVIHDPDTSGNLTLVDVVWDRQWPNRGGRSSMRRRVPRRYLEPVILESSVHQVAAGDQPTPVPNQHPAIQDLVVLDIEERKRMGIARYGTPLQGFNGRDALMDAYQEALDLVQYLRQALYERDNQ